VIAVLDPPAGDGGVGDQVARIHQGRDLIAHQHVVRRGVEQSDQLGVRGPLPCADRFGHRVKLVAAQRDDIPDMGVVGGAVDKPQRPDSVRDSRNEQINRVVAGGTPVPVVVGGGIPATFP
jgi:hypothetical protein